ncbi:MAG: cytochrome c3 family protein [Sedimentisphaerales bacterium]|nr:cytochrome c3 family protein [Sedimentisphaerales bacterium]
MKAARIETMNRYIFILMALVAAIGGVALIGCGGDNSEDDTAALVVDTDSPLLLAEPSENGEASGPPATKAAVENAACFVCHANYVEEKLAAGHAAINVGCTKCHGQSHPHRNDENHTTPPDRMFAIEAVVPLCQECHKSAKIDPQEIETVRREQPGKPASEPVVCTDCHGKHRLPNRAVRWDKTTGKLIPADKKID